MSSHLPLAFAAGPPEARVHVTPNSVTFAVRDAAGQYLGMVVEYPHGAVAFPTVDGEPLPEIKAQTVDEAIACVIEYTTVERVTPLLAVA